MEILFISMVELVRYLMGEMKETDETALSQGAVFDTEILIYPLEIFGIL